MKKYKFEMIEPTTDVVIDDRILEDEWGDYIERLSDFDWEDRCGIWAYALLGRNMHRDYIMFRTNDNWFEMEMSDNEVTLLFRLSELK